jgi:protoporphyrin/coproporphyrin ferrochelatase
MSDTAVLLMAYGSPDRLDQVEAYYTDIRRGRPPSAAQLEELVGRYEAIGGGSPLSRIVELQRAALEAELARRGTPMRVYAGMKHIEPRIGDVVAAMAADGVREAVAIALAPQASSMSSATYRRAVEAALPALGDRAPRFVFIDSWHDQPGLIEALAAGTAEAIARFPDPTRVRVLFTAHSLPARIVGAGDPYPEELARTAALVAERLGLESYDFAYQSAGRTDEAWLGPDLGDELRRLAVEGGRDVVVCAVGFVADHLEVLYDIDIEAQAIAGEVGVRLERAPTMNDDPTFIGGLADLASAALSHPASVG